MGEKEKLKLRKSSLATIFDKTKNEIGKKKKKGKTQVRISFGLSKVTLPECYGLDLELLD